ncbi:hypothetical protein P4B35_08745 [Pontiellaceae bacterium B12227]|nr:hypothetical protein [Pontiellaceae bacterium B12227]
MKISFLNAKCLVSVAWLCCSAALASATWLVDGQRYNGIPPAYRLKLTLQPYAVPRILPDNAGGIGIYTGPPVMADCTIKYVSDDPQVSGNPLRYIYTSMRPSIEFTFPGPLIDDQGILYFCDNSRTYPDNLVLRPHTDLGLSVTYDEPLNTPGRIGAMVFYPDMDLNKFPWMTPASMTNGHWLVTWNNSSIHASPYQQIDATSGALVNPSPWHDALQFSPIVEWERIQ